MCFVYFIFIFFDLISYFNNDSKKPGFFFPTIVKGKMVSHDPREVPSHNHSAIKKHQGFIAVVYNKTLSSSC